jgi:predicted glycogen debranching enzyme
MNISYGREICGNLSNAESREWLVTNGIGGYACGTLAGLLTRQYHGLLIAALKPPLARTLLLTKLEETIQYNHQSYPCFSNRWADGTVAPHGYFHIESFHLEGTIPVWTYACGDALIEKRIWMQLGSNTTYIRYTVKRASNPVHLSLKALVNYRDYHGNTQAGDWQMAVKQREPIVEIEAFPDAVPFYLWSDLGEVTLTHQWYRNFDLAVERYRGLSDREDHLHAATLAVMLNPGESLTVVASTHTQFNRD